MRKSPWRFLGLFTQVAMTIFFAVLISTALGVLLDRIFGTKIIFLFIFVFLGAASGLWVGYQTLIKISVDDLDK